ncbi:MAG: tetratricopeptide repeat protein [Spirosomataceae bacterium]
MEFLKKLSLVIAFFAGSFAVKGQTTADLQKAFNASYTSEYKGNFTQAIEEQKKAYKADSYECNLRLGWLYYNAKNYASSMEYYQKAIDLKKYSVEARMGYIKPANAAKKYDKAFEMYEAILKIDPYNSTANYWVGVGYYTAKKYDVAAKYFELVANMYPFDYDANHMLGWSYLNLGRTEEARVLFTKALLNRPGDKSASDGLALCRK